MSFRRIILESLLVFPLLGCSEGLPPVPQLPAPVTERVKTSQEIEQENRSLSRSLRLHGFESSVHSSRGVVVVISAGRFDPSGVRLLPEFGLQMRLLAQMLDTAGDRYIDIEGYSDSVGSIAETSEAARLRAEEVYQSLERGGVTPSRLRLNVYGEALARVSNNSSEGREQNRRVEVVVSNELIDRVP